ncbi:MAG: dihydrofolate reductase family protein [Patescibacteria group bacterium]
MKPRVILHNAVSLDGRLDHIKVDLGLYYGLGARFAPDAVLVGSGTILAAPDEIPPDDGAAPAPAAPGDEDLPLLVAADGRGRIRNWHFWRKQEYWRAAVALCHEGTPRDYLSYLEEKRVDCIVTGRERVDLGAALYELNARYGVRTVRVDSGGTLNGALLRGGLVDEVSLIVTPSLVGGESPRTFFRAPDLTGSGGAIRLALTHLERLEGGMVWLRYDVAG